MTLYDLVDGWLESEHCPANYPGTYTHEEYCNGVRDYAKEAGIPLAETNVHFAVGLYEKYCATAKKKEIPWEEFPEADKLRDISVFTKQEMRDEQRQIDREEAAKKEDSKDFLGIKTISEAHASEIIAAFQRKKTAHDKSDYGNYIVRPGKGKKGFVAIDNTTGDCWTEEFRSQEGAIAWLAGKSMDFIKENYPAEKPGQSLEDLCSEPIQGEAIIGGVLVVVDPRLKDVTYNEAVNYIDLCDKQKGNKTDKITEIVLKPEAGDNISIDWTVKPIPFNRIRRITGYLVGDLNRWNNAKKKEEHDRVKHTNALGR